MRHGADPDPLKPGRSRLNWAGRWFASLVLIVFAYRLAVVYTIRTVSCEAVPAMVHADGFPVRTVVPARHLVVLSYNIQGHAALVRGDHLERIAKTILEVKPDIVGLQEIHRGTWQARFDDHAADLARRTGMNILYIPSTTFLGGEFGNAILTRGKIVSGQLYDLTSFGEPRALLRATVEIDGARLNFFVSHLATWGKMNSRSREAQFQCIGEHLDASRIPYIVVGDFNCIPAAEEFQQFVSSRKLQFLSNGVGSTHKVTGQTLDYILGDRGWGLVSARALETGPSDHRPLLVELKWKAGGEENRPIRSTLP